MGRAAREKRQRKRLAVAQTARPSSARHCGECQACCFVLSVWERRVDEPPITPAYQRCRHQCAAGCDTYATRPGPCRAYRCMWHLGWATEGDRPDLLGLIFEAHPEGVVIVNETRRGAHLEAQGALRLRQVRAQVELVLVVLYGGKKRLMIAPPENAEELLARAGLGVSERMGVTLEDLEATRG